MKKAFEANFNFLESFDWYNPMKSNMPMCDVWLELENLILAKKPDFVFLQIQNTYAINLQNMQTKNCFTRISKLTKVINWTGDVRDNVHWVNWFYEFGKMIHLTLFSNEHQVSLLKSMGLESVAYLQTGFDDIYYNKHLKTTSNSPSIVFCANNYFGFQSFPLGEYRSKIAEALHNKYKDDFGLYGANWLNITTHRINNQQEASVYANAKIAISCSHYNYDRYFSDRLLRIAGTGGAMILSHDYKGVEKDWHSGHLDVFSDISDLLHKIDYYLLHEDERIKIVNLAYQEAHRNHTWDARCKQLLKIL